MVGTGDRRSLGCGFRVYAPSARVPDRSASDAALRFAVTAACEWYTPVMSTEELLAQVLRLSRPERARLAEEVLSSLEEPEDQVAAAWATELERRAREIADGRVQPVDWNTARAEILKELKQRREREHRSSS